MNRHVVVFDIDGTLADIDHRRHWVRVPKGVKKNWKAFNSAMHLDRPHEDIVRLLHSLAPDNLIVLCSGRDGHFRDVTVKWLEDNKIHYDHLLMRGAGDFRADHIIKVELLEQIERDFGRPWLWIDDRNQVVEAIRAQGIRVLQVCPGDF